NTASEPGATRGLLGAVTTCLAVTKTLYASAGKEHETCDRHESTSCSGSWRHGSAMCGVKIPPWRSVSEQPEAMEWSLIHVRVRVRMYRSVRCAVAACHGNGVLVQKSADRGRTEAISTGIQHGDRLLSCANAAGRFHADTSGRNFAKQCHCLDARTASRME